MTHFLQRACAALLVSCTLASLSAAEPQPAPKRVRPVLTQTLPHLQGDRLQATMLEVNYGPGESSPAHSHPCAVLGYVLQGAIRTQVKGEPQAIFKAGQGFYEAPNGVHALSANASKTEPAKFVAFFICDHEAPLSVDVPQAQTARPPHPPVLQTATGKESPMALPAAKVDEAAHPAPVPERQRRANRASSKERATATRQSLPDPKSISSPTQSRSVSDGLASAPSTWSTATLRDAEAPQ